MQIRSKVVWTVVAAGVALAAGGVMDAQGQKPMSPRGSAAAHVLGTWTNPGKQTFAAGGGSYENGKWIEVTYGRPLTRGRDVFGSGANYGTSLLIGAPIWRAGADVTTRLRTETPLVIGGKTVPAGEYSLFIDLKANDWTFVVSSWPAQQKYDPNNKTELWGAYNYTPDKDVLRAKMHLETLPHVYEELTWEFLDVTAKGGTLAIMWDKTMASVPFTFGG
jgi:hypothetical protein